MLVSFIIGSILECELPLFGGGISRWVTLMLVSFIKGFIPERGFPPLEGGRGEDILLNTNY